MAAVTYEDTSRTLWRKSTYSGNGGNCVEVSVTEANWVLVRDTAHRLGGTLSFPASTWRAFAVGLMQS